MPPPRNARPGKKELWFQAGRYFLRTIRREDASDRWASWLSDAWTVHVLNTAPQKLQKSDVADYIKTFDQRSDLLLGIFERGTRLHVGFIRLDIDYAAKEALVNAVIGEPDHRNRGATTDVFVPLLDFLFDKAGVERVTASILKRNQVTLRYLLRLGWQIDPAQDTQVRSKADGALLGLTSVSWTRDGYRAFRQTDIGKRILQRLALAEQAGSRRPPSRS
jgi:RimJ/RimL family protein N-acetyltransferase